MGSALEWSENLATFHFICAVKSTAILAASCSYSEENRASPSPCGVADEDVAMNLANWQKVRLDGARRLCFQPLSSKAKTGTNVNVTRT